MKTHELIGPALDWAVARASLLSGTARSLINDEVKQYSTDWSQGGPIIEREGINLVHFGSNHWGAHPAKGDFPFVYGSTPLVAAMRCFVSSELGDEIETPYRN